MKKNIVHFITGLEVGGAEMMLFKLLSATDRAKVNLLVVSLMNKGPIGVRIEAIGIRVHSLNLSRKFPFSLSLFALWKMWGVLKEFKPAILQGWMYHANIVVFFISLVFSEAKLYWNIRQTLYGMKRERLMTKIVIKAGRWLSKYCDGIIYNSKKSLEQHSKCGYSSKNAIVIPNGFDADLFSPFQYQAHLTKLKKQLKIPSEALIIGLVARYHPMKGHSIFLEASLKLLDKFPDTHFVFVGRGVTCPSLSGIIEERCKSSFHFLEEREDIPELLSIVDIAVNSSIWGEGFSNAIGEAMLMGIPCVVTDVGDSAFIVGDCGVVVTPGDINSLVSGMLSLVDMSSDARRQLGHKSRVRMIDQFLLEASSRKYGLLYGI